MSSDATEGQLATSVVDDLPAMISTCTAAATKADEPNKKDVSMNCDTKDGRGGDDDRTEDTKEPGNANADDMDAKSEHEKRITYSSDGMAIYSDPKTNCRYKWCTQQNAWLPCDSQSGSDPQSDVPGMNGADPYENEHYKWCSATKQWLPKERPQVAETEHYRWDAEKSVWVPKAANGGELKYSIDEDGQRIYTDQDGVVFFWDNVRSAWFPKIDDDFMARYQMSYGFIDNTSTGEQEKQRQQEATDAKRKADELHQMTAEAAASAAAASSPGGPSGNKRKATQEPAKWFDLEPEHNTKVYVSNLPLDITMDEFAELMSKCGMIMRDAHTQKHKLKLYSEADGQPKGDGLCDYIKVESVGLALNILDEYELRGHKIRVQRAKFQMRGEYNPSLKPKRKKKDKEKLLKLKEKLFDWRPERMRGERSKNEKVVIIKNFFQPEIFEQEVQLILDYQNDLREECNKCGTVRKVVVYDRHPEGVAQVNMASPEEADVVIQMMNGRFFGQRQLVAEHWDGKTKYKVTESETEVQQRLTKWDQYLGVEAAASKRNTKATESATPSELLPPTTELADKCH